MCTLKAKLLVCTVCTYQFYLVCRRVLYVFVLLVVIGTVRVFVVLCKYGRTVLCFGFVTLVFDELFSLLGFYLHAGTFYEQRYIQNK